MKSEEVMAKVEMIKVEYQQKFAKYEAVSCIRKDIYLESGEAEFGKRETIKIKVKTKKEIKTEEKAKKKGKKPTFRQMMKV